MCSTYRSTTFAKGAAWNRGRCFLVDTAHARIIPDGEIKGDLMNAEAYDEWLHAGLLDIATLPLRPVYQPNHNTVVRRQLSFGYTEEDLRVLLTRWPRRVHEPLGSMGTDTRSRCSVNVPGCSTTTSVELFAQGHQSAAGRDPRGDRHLDGGVMGPEQNTLEPSRRRAGKSCCTGRSWTRWGWQDRAHQRRR